MDLGSREVSPPFSPPHPAIGGFPPIVSTFIVVIALPHTAQLKMLTEGIRFAKA